MLVFGHPKIPCPQFIQVEQVEQIAKISAKHCIYFKASSLYAFDLANHCTKQQVKYAVGIENLKEFVWMVNFKPAYLVVYKKPENYQSLADDYLLDARILWVIDHEEQVLEALKMKIDGVIFSQILSFNPIVSQDMLE
ncbi:hypothetical protein [Helicobacter suis]|uniref:hypothetical protein n=1 Tax=Helicobacter suis TaxID=104628 RepID=UPI001F07D4C9|nr:hypothetical protein [Helicobacter suis]